MGRVLFYHLTRSPLAQTLAQLLGKALEAGMTAEVRGRDRAALETLDAALWLGPEEGFLPHGLAGGPHDALQPVLLTTAGALRPGTRCLMAVDGAEVLPGEAAALDRVCILFDGEDEAAKDVARAQWRNLTAGGAVAEYWSQETGSWQRKMTTGG